MSMDVNRRSFLIGSASAVALAVTGLPAEPSLCRGILSPVHSFRRIVELTFQMQNPLRYPRFGSMGIPTTLHTIRVMRSGGSVLFQAAISQPWWFRWVSHDDTGIVIREKESLRFEIDPPPPYRTAVIEIFSQTKEDPLQCDMSDLIYEKLAWGNGEFAQVSGPVRMALPAEPEPETSAGWFRRMFG